jgi:shikimate dehydrogenase
MSLQLGLTGYPLSHSFSPRIHTAALQACGLEGDYSLFPVHPDNRQGLKDLLSRVRSGEIHGLNVTVPHKQNVIQFLDELTPTAAAIGAVNTIYLSNGKLMGDNTDAPGFLADLRKFLTTETRGHGDFNVLVLGAGGSAHAVVYALVNDGWTITVAARRIEQAQQLASHFEGVNAIESNLQTFHPSNLQLIVNTTPIGMTPDIAHSPWPEKFPFPPRAAIYDLVYNPPETKLVRDACLHGLPATTGLGMLIEQAALSFEIWTGCKPPREALLEAVNQSSY